MKRNSVIPTVITDSLKADGTFVDNTIASTQDKLGLKGIFKALKIKKRSGESTLEQIVYALLIMPLLAVNNVYCFAGKFLNVYIPGGQGILYSFLSKQNINWSLIQLRLSQRLYQTVYTDDETTAFVVDDTIKRRRGKQVQAMSSHYDHNEGRHVMGQQILQFGVASPKGFLPISSQIFVGKTKATERKKEFIDKRNAVAKSYEIAHTHTKHQMLGAMLKNALSNGFYSHYLIGDAWFGCKKNISLALDNDLTAIFMMKRNRAKYRYQGQEYTLKGLYRLLRKNMTVFPEKGYSYFSVVVEYNLSDKDDDWIPVKLIFSRAKRAPKNSWVVLLCSDSMLEDRKVFETYALRWSIEVYFKEIKQNFGFLKEQTGAYETHYASIHLAAMRYVLLFYAYLTQNAVGFAEIRKRIGFQMELLTFTCLAWEIISALINKVLDQRCRFLGDEFVESLKKAISAQVTGYLHYALQLDPESAMLQQKAEKLGL